jgi:hypothetical protein
MLTEQRILQILSGGMVSISGILMASDKPMVQRWGVWLVLVAIWANLIPAG